MKQASDGEFLWKMFYVFCYIKHFSEFSTKYSLLMVFLTQNIKIFIEKIINYVLYINFQKFLTILLRKLFVIGFHYFLLSITNISYFKIKF